jgi:hypothetical protein
MLTWRSSTCSCVCAGLSRPISRDGDRAELQHWRMPLRWIPGSCRQPWGATGFQDADHRYAPVPIGQRLQAPRRLGRPARSIVNARGRASPYEAPSTGRGRASNRIIALDPAREILALLIDWCRIDHQSRS